MKITISRSQWEELGKLAGWTKGRTGDEQAELEYREYSQSSLKNQVDTAIIRQNFYATKINANIVGKTLEVVVEAPSQGVKAVEKNPQKLQQALKDIQDWLDKSDKFKGTQVKIIVKPITKTQISSTEWNQWKTADYQRGRVDIYEEDAVLDRPRPEPEYEQAEPDSKRTLRKKKSDQPEQALTMDDQYGRIELD